MLLQQTAEMSFLESVITKLHSDFTFSLPQKIFFLQLQAAVSTESAPDIKITTFMM